MMSSDGDDTIAMQPVSLAAKRMAGEGNTISGLIRLLTSAGFLLFQQPVMYATVLTAASFMAIVLSRF
jgi:hypothetical protein